MCFFLSVPLKHLTLVLSSEHVYEEQPDLVPPEAHPEHDPDPDPPTPPASDQSGSGPGSDLPVVASRAETLLGDDAGPDIEPLLAVSEELQLLSSLQLLSVL